MKTLETTLKTVLNKLPAPVVKGLHRLRFALLQPKLYPALMDYTYTDARLKCVHILEAMNYARVVGLPNVYFEFGCHSARTFSAAVRAAKYLKMKDPQFYAFDSFQGLPPTNPDEDGNFETGEFATPVKEFVRLVYKKTGFRIDRRNVIEGFYSDSLTSGLQACLPKVGVVHIDVDLYSSAAEVLEFIKPLMVRGTVLIFDDWYCFSPGANKGEVRAVKEFCDMNPSFAMEEWKAYSTLGKSFFVTSLPGPSSRT